MQISEAAGGVPAPGTEPCRFPKLEECAHFHYERVQLPELTAALQTNMAQSLHSQHSISNEEDGVEWYMVQVTSRDECWLVQRNFENFKMLDSLLHECIYDRKISQLPDLSSQSSDDEDILTILAAFLDRFSKIADNSVNCGPILNWFQMDNKGHRLLVPSEDCRSINTPAVAAAYSVRRYVSQARDELNLEVGDMISVIDMASPGESMWWRGKRGFQVGFFPQHCVHIIGDKIPRNMPLPPPVVGSLALTPIKPVLRKHGKLITFFRSFILNRPSRRRLKQSGILKERVFGCDLGEHLLNSGHRIPMVLKCCAEFIETHGIVDGIYRLSGVNSNIQKLRNAFDEDRIPDLYTEEILQDIHSVACLLKMYFRELPNPLCTYQLYQTFVNAVQGCNSAVRSSEIDNDRLLKMREAVQKLPPPHYRTLKYLMKHLAKVAEHGARTGMTTRNVAIVWAPNLLRSEELEYGGVAALQGVGVQAVVTEFLICYSDLIFCDHLPNLDLPLELNISLSPKQNRPKSLAISTPTKLLSLEEARTKILSNKTEECNYIEVGGGPKNLPKKYHTVIDLPAGTRKRTHTKRSPLGWRSFFSKSRNNSQGNLAKNNRKATTPGITIAEKSVTESDLTDMKRKLRTVKSAESLTSGHSEPASIEIDVLGPLQPLNKPPGHNRSVSHDSYFDTLQGSQNNSEGSLLDLSEIQLNFDLEDLEMRIFSEDESLVSSPRIQRDSAPRRMLTTRSRPDEFHSNTNSGNPSPKKQARVVLSPDAMSRKRTRLEDQLSDIQFIDCCTPDNIVSTTAVIHTLPEVQTISDKQQTEYQPRNKSPRSSDSLDKRQSLNLEPSHKPPAIPKSLTEMDIGNKYAGSNSIIPSPAVQSPSYKQLGDSSANTTPGISSDFSSPAEITYTNLNQNESRKSFYDNIIGNPSPKSPSSPTYENILTTISITYKSPRSSLEHSPVKTPVSKKESHPYENVTLVNTEKAMIPTSTASLPIQQASQPEFHSNRAEGDDHYLKLDKEQQRPRSLSALEDMDTSKERDMRPNLSSSAVCDTNEQYSFSNLTDQKTATSSNHSSGSNIQYTQSLSSAPYYFIDNTDQLSPSDLSLSEVIHSSTDNITTSNTSSFPVSPSGDSPSPNVSPTQLYDSTTQEALTPVSLSGTHNMSEESLLDDTENVATSFDVTQFTSDSEKLEGSSSFARPTAMSIESDEKLESTVMTIEIDEEKLESRSSSLPRPTSINLIDFSPVEPTQQASPTRNSCNDKRKSSETESLDDNAIYQQVKYFRRSIHEVNALLELDEVEKSEEKKETNEDCESIVDIEKPPSPEINYDSLESDNVHVYENIEGEELRKDSIYENVQIGNENVEMSGENVKMTSENLEMSSENIETIDKTEDKDSICEDETGMNEDHNDVNEIKSFDKLSVRDLKCKFEDNDRIRPPSNNRNSDDNVSVKSFNDAVLVLDKLEKKVEVETKIREKENIREGTSRVKKFYEKDGLPPCLRARNLKHQLKTRSLDEEEFAKEFSGSMERRKSLDEGMGYKTNSLPKTLNQPKILPLTNDDKLSSLHLSHSTENISSADEDQKKRERIERYKEERRKFLHEKYRSESFKEDKDVILSKLKIYKPKEEKAETNDITNSLERPARIRRRSSRSDDSAGEIATDSLEDETAKTKSNPPVSNPEKSNICERLPKTIEPKPVTESLRTKVAIFEVQPNQRISSSDTVRNNRSSESHGRLVMDSPNTKRVQECKYIFSKIDSRDGGDSFGEDFIRHKKRDEEFLRSDRRRHTYESRERETEADRLRRISLETRSPRKEKESPTYCIKDMKAIFESKSKQ